MDEVRANHHSLSSLLNNTRQRWTPLKLSVTCLGIVFFQHSSSQSDGWPRVLFPMGDANPPVEVHVKDAETGKGALGGCGLSSGPDSSTPADTSLHHWGSLGLSV